MINLKDESGSTSAHDACPSVEWALSKHQLLSPPLSSLLPLHPQLFPSWSPASSLRGADRRRQATRGHPAERSRGGSLTWGVPQAELHSLLLQLQTGRVVLEHRGHVRSGGAISSAGPLVWGCQVEQDVIRRISADTHKKNKKNNTHRVIKWNKHEPHRNVMRFQIHQSLGSLQHMRQGSSHTCT